MSFLFVEENNITMFHVKHCCFLKFSLYSDVYNYFPGNNLLMLLGILKGFEYLDGIYY